MNRRMENWSLLEKHLQAEQFRWRSLGRRGVGALGRRGVGAREEGCWCFRRGGRQTKGRQQHCLTALGCSCSCILLLTSFQTLLPSQGLSRLDLYKGKRMLTDNKKHIFLNVSGLLRNTYIKRSVELRWAEGQTEVTFASAVIAERAQIQM